jgi:hypothetical protein
VHLALGWWIPALLQLLVFSQDSFMIMKEGCSSDRFHIFNGFSLGITHPPCKAGDQSTLDKLTAMQVNA